jgi:hypothetical protein
MTNAGLPQENATERFLEIFAGVVQTNVTGRLGTVTDLTLKELGVPDYLFPNYTLYNTALDPTNQAGPLLLAESPVGLTNTTYAAYSVWYGVGQNITEAVEGIQYGLQLSSIQFNALLEWYKRYSERVVILMVEANNATTGISNTSLIPLYQWGYGDYEENEEVSPTLYLGEVQNLALWATVGVTIDPVHVAGLFLTAETSLFDPTNLAQFLMGYSMGGTAQLATLYNLTTEQVDAVAAYFEYVIEPLATAQVFVQSSYLFRADTVNSTFSF